MKNYFSTRWGIIGVGAFIGVMAALLQKLGNPGNMGICVACFERDIAGAIGLHRAGVARGWCPVYAAGDYRFCFRVSGGGLSF